jgi:hypothetical protein
VTQSSDTSEIFSHKPRFSVTSIDEEEPKWRNSRMNASEDFAAILKKRDQNRKERRPSRSESDEARTRAWSLVKERDHTHSQRMQKWRSARFWALTTSLFAYAAACIVLPRWRHGTVTCHQGFFWEMHMMFFSLFWVTKVVELIFYIYDPSVEGADVDWVGFLMRFIPSFFSYCDGYFDSTSIQVAASCGEEYPLAGNLSWIMLASYSIGVILIQWVVLAYWAVKDPSQACLAKLVHMDLLASSIQVPEDHQITWCRAPPSHLLVDLVFRKRRVFNHEKELQMSTSCLEV